MDAYQKYLLKRGFAPGVAAMVIAIILQQFVLNPYSNGLLNEFYAKYDIEANLSNLNESTEALKAKLPESGEEREKALDELNRIMGNLTAMHITMIFLYCATLYYIGKGVKKRDDWSRTNITR